jgi:ribose-phosphate pyrophosphokinase
MTSMRREAFCRISQSKIKEFVLTDLIMPTEAVKVARNICTMQIANLPGEAVKRTAMESSVSSLFD